MTGAAGGPPPAPGPTLTMVTVEVPPPITVVTMFVCEALVATVVVAPLAVPSVATVAAAGE